VNALLCAATTLSAVGLHLYNAVLWPSGENRQLYNYSNSNCVVSIEVSHLIVHLVYLLWTLFGLEFEVRPSEL